MKYPSLKCACGYSVPLPYPSTPEAVLRQSAWSPKAILSRELACLECGRVSTYEAKDIRWKQVPPEQLASRVNTVCWCIGIGCAEELCDLAIEFHLLTPAQKGTEEIRLLLRRLFEKGLFQQLKCDRGHAASKSRILGLSRVG